MRKNGRKNIVVVVICDVPVQLFGVSVCNPGRSSWVSSLSHTHAATATAALNRVSCIYL